MPQCHVLHEAEKKLPLAWITISKAGMQYTAPHVSQASLSFSIRLAQIRLERQWEEVTELAQLAWPAVDLLSHSLDHSSILTVAAFHHNCLGLQGEKQKRHTGRYQYKGMQGPCWEDLGSRVWPLATGMGGWDKAQKLSLSFLLLYSPTARVIIESASQTNCLKEKKKVA